MRSNLIVLLMTALLGAQFAQSSSVLTSEVPPGAVIMFAGATCPTGTITADGTSLLRAGRYAKLFAAIGTVNGTADGTHFNAPDYRGRFIRMVDGAAARDPDSASRTTMNAGGATGNAVGSIEDEAFKSHTHTMTAFTTAFGGSNTSPAYNATSSSTTITTNATGGSETRPINAYAQYCVKY